MKHTAVILSGGKNSRMNYDNKAFLTIEGRHFIEVLISKLSSFDEILIATNKPEEYLSVVKNNVRTITDIVPDHGPLSGMHSGLINASNNYCFFVSCDMPFVPKDYIDYCIELPKDYDVAVPYWNGFYEPTCGMYSKSTLARVEWAIENNIHKPIKIYPHVKVHTIEEPVLRIFGEPDKIFANINTPEEYLKIEINN